jgi:hypothetical protein
MSQSTRERREHYWQLGEEGKQCAKCLKWCRLYEYNRSSRLWDGLQVWCRTCAHRHEQESKARNRPLSAIGRKCAACCAPISDLAHTRQKYCSADCRQWGNQHPGMTRALNRKCLACNKSISAGANYRIKFCGGSCRGWYKNTPYKGEKLARIGRVCAHSGCSNSIDHLNLKAKYCGKPCLYKVRHIAYGPARNEHNRQNRSKAAWSIVHDWQRLVNRYHHCCAYCGKYAPCIEQDHVIPRVRGGKHTIGNLLPACPSCNRRKNSSLLVEWRYRTRKK